MGAAMQVHDHSWRGGALLFCEGTEGKDAKVPLVERLFHHSGVSLGDGCHWIFHFSSPHLCEDGLAIYPAPDNAFDARQNRQLVDQVPLLLPGTGAVVNREDCQVHQQVPSLARC